MDSEAHEQVSEKAFREISVNFAQREIRNFFFVI